MPLSGAKALLTNDGGLKPEPLCDLTSLLVQDEGVRTCKVSDLPGIKCVELTANVSMLVRWQPKQQHVGVNIMLARNAVVSPHRVTTNMALCSL